MGDGRFGEPQRKELKISAHVFADHRSRDPRPVVETTWEPEDGAAAVAIRLREQLERSGRWHGDGTLDWPMALSNLQRALDLAIRSRRRDNSGPISKGALMVLVDDAWMITDAGLECPGHGFILSASDFPDRAMAAYSHGADEVAKFKPDPPDWVERDVWDDLVAQAWAFFPIRRGPYLAAPQWIPLEEGPPD